MNAQNTIYELERLRLNGMKRVYETVLSLPQQEQPSIHHFMSQLTEAELQERLHNQPYRNVPETQQAQVLRISQKLRSKPLLNRSFGSVTYIYAKVRRTQDNDEKYD